MAHPTFFANISVFGRVGRAHAVMIQPPRYGGAISPRCVDLRFPVGWAVPTLY